MIYVVWGLGLTKKWFQINTYNDAKPRHYINTQTEVDEKCPRPNMDTYSKKKRYKKNERKKWLENVASPDWGVDLSGAAYYQAYNVVTQWFRSGEAQPFDFELTQKIDIDGEGRVDVTPFAVSAALGDVKMMRLLLAYCEEHNISIANGCERAKGKQRDYATPLMAAVMGRSISAIRTLQKYCPDLDMNNRESLRAARGGHMAAMSYAAQHGLEEITALLWFEGGSLFTENDDSYLPFMLAGNNRYVEMRSWLFNRLEEEEKNRKVVEHGTMKWGPDMSCPVERGDLFEAKEGNKTAMYYAAEHNQFELVKIMLSEGVSVLPPSGTEESEDGSGYRPSDVARWKGFKKMENLLRRNERIEEYSAHTARKEESGSGSGSDSELDQEESGSEEEEEEEENDEGTTG